MLTPQKMVKVGIVCPNTVLDRVIGKLYDMKNIQIEDHEKNHDFDIGHPLVHGEEVAKLVLKLKSIASYLNINLTKADFKPRDYTTTHLKDRIEEIYEKIRERVEKIEFYDKIATILKNRTHEKALAQAKYDSPRAKDTSSVFFCGLSKKDVEADIKEVSETYGIKTIDVDGAKLTLLFMPKSKIKEARKILDDNLFVALNPSIVKKSLPGIKAKLTGAGRSEGSVAAEKKKEKKELDKVLNATTANHYDFLINANNILEKESVKAVAPLKFAASKHTHIINGWVAEKEFENLKESLELTADDRVYVNKIKLKKKETAPVLLKNPKLARSFQFLLDLFSLPDYREFDPTLLMFLTFPLFFGFMLGDMGYGFLTLALFIWMKTKFRKGALRSLLNILIASSIGTIIFGALFGEVFGAEVLFGYELPHILSRGHQIQDLLSISLVIGVAHLALGLLIGLVNVARIHNLKHAIMEKAGWLLLLPGILWALMLLDIISGFTANAVSVFMPSSMIVGILAGLGVLIIIKSEGVIGIIELPAILSNTLSYARLMAVGLASVMLAIIINEQAGSMFASGGFGIIFGIIILLVGHTINILLGLLGPFLHSLRLHYVEFFGKFYQGGGKKFTPFGEDDKT